MNPTGSYPQVGWIVIIKDSSVQVLLVPPPLHIALIYRVDFGGLSHEGVEPQLADLPVLNLSMAKQGRDIRTGSGRGWGGG